MKDFCVVLVDPRTTEDYSIILSNLNFDFDFKLYIFTEDKTISFLEKEIKKYPHLSEINEIIEIPKQYMLSPGYIDYNKLFKSEWMWEYINEENILVVQTDGAICDHGLVKIDEFKDFPYIGCAYSKEEGLNNFWKNDKCPEIHFYGVGGISFRHRSFMLECVKNKESIEKRMCNGINTEQSEDVFFSSCLGFRDDLPHPTHKDMHNFCVESDYQKQNMAPIGLTMSIHKPHLMGFDDGDRLLEQCPIAHHLFLAPVADDQFQKKYLSRHEHFSEVNDDRIKYILCISLPLIYPIIVIMILLLY